jgi:hypothetical protein
MLQAMGFGIFLIVMSIFLPDVLHALEEFLLAFLHMGTAVVSSITPPQTGVVLQTLQ